MTRKALIATLLALAACGSDAKPTPRPSTAAKPGAPTAAVPAAAARQNPATKEATLTAYTKIEDLCMVAKLDDKGNPALDDKKQPIMLPDKMCGCTEVKAEPDDGKLYCKRPELTEADFKPEGNRDPFHSYLIDTVVENQEPNTQDVHITIADACKDAKIVAANQGISELKLVGIVSRGTKAYSLWIDQQQRGHRAQRNDCLSKDHAKIKDIQENYVILQRFPPQGASTQQIPEETIALHPEDEDLNNQLNFGSDGE